MQRIWIWGSLFLLGMLATLTVLAIRFAPGDNAGMPPEDPLDAARIRIAGISEVGDVDEVIYRVKAVLDVDRVPTEGQLRDVCNRVLPDDRHGDRVLVHVFLPGMDLLLTPYVSAEYREKRCQLFRIHHDMLDDSSLYP